MLLRFGVSNHRSINQYQELSLVAASIKDAGADLISLPHFKLNALPCVGLYGANAAGKSNLLRAFKRLRWEAIYSYQHNEVDDPIGQSYFKLDPRAKNVPTVIDCDFLMEGDRYHYGLIFNENEIVEEWLYQYSANSVRKTRKVLFHRNTSEKKEPFYFGPDLKGDKKKLAGVVRKNSSVIAAAAANNHAQLKKIYDFFQHSIEFLSPETSEFSKPEKALVTFDDRKKKKPILDFLKLADTGIVDFYIREKTIDADAELFSNELQSLVEKFTGKTFSDKTTANALQTELVLVHAGKDGATCELTLKDESEGTRALLSLLGTLFSKLAIGGILVIDELNTCLHPLVSRQMVRLFNDKKTNPKGAQLVFSTHDTNLLCGGLLRRDQVWFAEKDSSGATHIYPLTDIQTKGTDNLMRGYLEGRFGAIPFYSNWSELPHG